MRQVGRKIGVEPQPAQLFEDAAAHLRRVFADAGSKDQRVEPAHGGSQRGHLARGAVAEQLHGFACGFVAAGE